MNEFFSAMDPMLRTFWYIAMPATAIFLIQALLTFVGADFSDGIDADFDGDLDFDHHGPFQVFSFRNLINFMLGFGWAGVTFYELIPNRPLLLLSAFIVGAAMVLLFFFIMQQIKKLAEDNTFKIEHTVGKTAQVYLTVPAAKSGKGKVLVSVNGTTHEMAAVTGGDKIDTSTLVKVSAVIDGNLLLVEKI